jgi:hypothetical protein
MAAPNKADTNASDSQKKVTNLSSDDEKIKKVNEEEEKKRKQEEELEKAQKKQEAEEDRLEMLREKQEAREDKQQKKREELEDIEEKKREEKEEKLKKKLKEVFDQVNGDIPKLLEKIGEALPPIESVNFTAESEASVFRLKAGNLKESDRKDYFLLSLAQQEDLYDRIGFFKGMVVDHTQEEMIQQSFREVFKRKNGLKTDPTSAVTVFYKKPKNSGYYENHFTSSEIDHQIQKNGVFNFGFSAAAAYSGIAVKWGVGIGFSYGKSSMERTTTISKRVYATTNYFLPKIELSFDVNKPCASQDFVDAVSEALGIIPGEQSFEPPKILFWDRVIKILNVIELILQAIVYLKGQNKQKEIILKPSTQIVPIPSPIPVSENNNSISLGSAATSVNSNTLEARFYKLTKVLNEYGQFIPTHLVIGGRLYGTNESDITNENTIGDATEKWAGETRAAISGMMWSAKLNVNVSKFNEIQNASMNVNESQNRNINAIGGEGSFLSDPSEWAGSLNDYKAWSIIKYQGLIPALELLPKDLRDLSLKLLKDVVSRTTIEDLLENKLHFLFYNGYNEHVGQYAKKKYFYIQNAKNKYYLTLKKDIASEGGELDVLNEPKGWDKQLWWYTMEGRIVSKVIERGEEYALTFTSPNKLAISVVGKSKFQTWEISGGLIKIKVEETEYKLAVNDKVLSVTAGDNLWNIVDIDEDKVWSYMNNNRHKLNEKYLNIDAVFDPANILSSNNDQFILKYEKETSSGNEFWRVMRKQSNTELWRSISKQIDIQFDIQFDLNTKKIINGGEKKLILRNDGNLELWFDDIKKWASGVTEPVYACIKSNSNNYVLSIEHNECSDPIAVEGKRIMMAPYIAGNHQLWRINEKGQFISKLNPDLAVEPDTSGNLVLKKLEHKTTQFWEFFNVDFIKNLSTEKVIAISPENGNRDCQGASVIIADQIQDSKFQTWSLEYQKKDAGRNIYIRRGNDGNDGNYLHLNEELLSGTAIPAEGVIKGICFFAENTRDQKAILKLFINGIWQNAGNESFDHNKFACINEYDSAPVYIPQDKTIKSLSFRISGTRLAMQIKVDQTSIQNDNSDHKFVTDKERWIDTNQVIAEDDEEVVGFGIRPKGNRVAPYLVVRKK